MFYINISEDDLALKTHLQSSHIFAAEKKNILTWTIFQWISATAINISQITKKKVLQQWMQS